MTAKIGASADGTYGVLSVGSQEAFRFGADNSGQLAGFRNKIINGGMQIWQRGTSFTSAGFTADRWYQFGGVSGITFSNPISRIMQINCAAGAANLNLVQALESDTVNPIKGKVVTFSFLGYTGAGSQQVEMRIQKNATADSIALGSWSNVASSTITLTTTPTKFTLTATVPNDGSANGLSVGIYAASIAGPINLFISEFQLELGSIATPFEQRPIGLELSLCQRYYEKGGWRAHASAASDYLGSSLNFKQTKRASPTVAITSTLDGAVGMIAVDGVNKSGVISAFSTEGVMIYINGQQTTVNQFAGCNWTASAEL